MSKIIKDKGLKLKLIKYYLGNEWFPHMEAEIYPPQGISSNRKAITDLDTMALIPNVYGNLELLIGDCKTLKNQSPVSRSLWLSGLMKLISASRGIVLLSNNNIERDHKHLSSKININLLSESDLETLISKTSPNYLKYKSALSKGDLWEEYYNLYKKFPQLAGAVKFVKNDFWNIEDDKLKLRKTLFTIRDIRRELNPDRPEHLLLLTDLISLFTLTLSKLVIDVFNQNLVPSEKELLERELKIMIWGGMDQVRYWNKLYQVAIQKDNDAEIELPEWNNFVQMIRQLLEKPFEVAYLPLFLREIAFNFIDVDSSENNYSSFLSTKHQTNIPFAMPIISYVCKASKLPKEFEQIIIESVMKTITYK